MTRMTLLAAALLLPTLAAYAQQDLVAPREGDIYNGQEHQPGGGDTNQQQTNAVQSLDKQVMQNAQTPTGTAAGCTANKTRCGR